MMRPIFTAALCIVAPFAAPAQAGLVEPTVHLTNPQVVPQPATAGVPLELRLQSDGCGGGNNPPTITWVGTTLTALYLADEPCGVPLEPYFISFRIGAFPPGTYTLIWQPYSNYSGTDGYTPTTIQFTVEPAAVPAGSFGTWSALVFAVGALGAFARRKHRARTFQS